MEVAFVVVPLFTVKRSMVDEALRTMPMVLVGVMASWFAVNCQLEPVPAAPTASTPSQSPAPPVMVVQKSAQVEPVTPLKVRPPVTAKFVVVALVPVKLVVKRLVEVALVEVVLRVVRLLMVEDAETAIPMVEVGESAELTIDQSRKDEEMKSTPGIAATTPPVEFVRRSDEVIPVNARLVVVALVDVASRTVRRSMVEDARTMMPIEVVVGRRLPATMLNVSPTEEPAGA